MSELPTGWTTCRIRDVVLPFEIVDPAKKPDQPFTYVDISSIDNRTQRIHEPKTILGKDAPSRARRRIEAGDILFSTVRTYLKNIAVVPPELDGAVTSTGIAVLRPSPKIETNYLFHLVCSSDFLTNIGAVMDGTLYPAVTDRDVLNQEIPLPPLDEQRRIVARLDALLARTRRAREELARVPALAERAKQAVLAKAFSGKLTEEWRIQREKIYPSLETLSSVCTSISDGDHQPPPKANEGVPFITISAINDGKLQLSHALRFVPRTYLETLGESRRARYGDVLFSVTGSIAIPALVNTDEDFVFQRHIAILKPNLKNVTSKFLYHILAAPQVTKQAYDVATGTAQLTVPLSGLRKLQVPIYNLDEQAEIVARIEAAFARIDRAAAEAGRALALLERTEQAALAKAFRGELG